MGLRGHAGTAGGVDGEWDFREGRLQEQGVGDDADVGAEPDEIDGDLLSTTVPGKEMGQVGGSE